MFSFYLEDLSFKTFFKNLDLKKNVKEKEGR